MFRLHVALLWTINDFPEFGNLSRWSTRGEKACPYCSRNTKSRWLNHGRKYCYMDHRRFLPLSHKFRKDRVSFYGTMEWGYAPSRLSGSILKREVDDILTEYKKEDVKKRKRDEMEKKKKDEKEGGSDKNYWKKKFIFFKLPYWEHNSIRHNLDVIHIEKNVYDNILWTLLGVVGKSKDNLKSRRDLKNWGLRRPLYLQQQGATKVYLPSVCFTMNKVNKDVFLKVLKSVKVPNGYASNISRCVHMKEHTIFGHKSQDSHTNGPNQFARRFKRYDINGFRFHTKNTEKSRVTQNTGVV
ncbi:hypothetical protein LWI28_005804 [Acer negundo]|uniref:Uncharacterized protein n=1 Tax=Acer negundo TaxID=4023 RepID=A0AAD5JGX4_ACENE|nr:hypothetical protein LWI28_005804 [Acer negundo]